MNEDLNLATELDTQKRGNMVTLCTVFLAVAPIFDPYLLVSFGGFSLKVLDVPMLIIATLLIISAGVIFWDMKKDSILIMVVMFAMLTMISFFAAEGSRSIINASKNCIIELIFVISATMMWKSSSRELFIRIACKIAFWATIFLLIQYIAVNLGFTGIFNGKIPFFEMGKHDYWAALIDPNTGDIRVHSIFQEPAYYGMYVLPIFAYTLQNRDYKKSLFYLLGLILSSSLVAILGAVIVFIANFLLMEDEVVVKRVLKGIVIFLAILGLLAILYSQVNFVRYTVDYALERIFSVSDDLKGDRLGSNKIRLLGYIDRFVEYPTFFKIFGVGNNQFSAYLGVTSYSNTVVSTILNYGICGILIFLACVLRWFNQIKEYRIFIVVFVLVMASDYQLVLLLFGILDCPI